MEVYRKHMHTRGEETIQCRKIGILPLHYGGLWKHMHTRGEETIQCRKIGILALHYGGL